MTKKITKTDVDNLTCEGKDTFLWCGELPGFGVRCQPGGRKTYVVRYRTQAGVQRKQKLGRCCDFPPDKARDMARQIFTAVAQGLDPIQARREEKASPTMRELEERYTREWSKPFKKPSSQSTDALYWRLYILPAMGDKKVKDVTRADCLSLFGSLSEKRATANQVIALLSKAFNLAEEWEWRQPMSNPCSKIKKHKLPKRGVALTIAQINRLNETLTKLEAEKHIPPTFSRYIRLLLLTGCRKMEILGARRDWIDASTKTLELPDSKVGPRNIKLSSVALGMMASDEESEWLIPSANGKKHLLNIYRKWAIVKAAAELPPKLRLHDLRHSVGSLAHSAGRSQKQVAQLLGHSNLQTTEVYLHDIDGDADVTADMLAQMISKGWKNEAQSA